MPSTYNKIQTVTVGSGGSSTIQFTNIPQTFTDLKILISGRGTSVDTDFFVTFNGNSAATYNYVQMYGYVTGNGADRGSNQTSLNVGVTSGASSSSANAFSANEINILNYSLSTQNKAVGSLNVTENNGQVAYLNMKQGHWANTSAITSLSLACSNGNWAEYTSATLYGINKIGSQIADTVGATVSTDGTYYYYTFLGSGSFTPLINTSVDYLVVAGAGGGGGPGVSGGGGGGAGGVRCTIGATGGGGSLESKLALTANTSYTVTVGAGGAADTIGNNSVFSTITSTAGGRGKSSGSAANANGGSGGGGNGTAAGISANIAGTGTANQGYTGGDGFPGPGDNARNSGGGGGAGSVGAAGTASVGGNGGSGITTSISGTSTVYAGGGGGGVGYGTRGTGTDGGGNGGNGSTAGTAGTANRGAGGGGGGRNESTGTQQNPGAGGSGIVIIRVGV